MPADRVVLCGGVHDAALPFADRNPLRLSAPAAADLAGALAPLKPTHILLTHADETDYPGPVIAHAIAAGRPLSYVSGADTLLPAAGADLAKRLCK